MSAGQESGSPIRENRTLLPAPLPPDEARGTLAAAAGVSTVGLRPPFDTPAAAFSSCLSRHSHLDCRARYWPPEGGRLTPQVQLFQLLVFVFLILDIFPDDCFISTYGRDEISACPEALTHKPALPLAIGTGKVDRAFAFDVPDHLTNRVFRWNRQQHVNMIGHQMAFLDPAFPLFGQLSKYRTEMSLQFAIQHLPAVFWNENDVIFAVPLGVI